MIKNNTADIDVTFYNFFEDLFETEENEDDTAKSIDEVTWMLWQEPCRGGSINAMARFTFKSEDELFEALADRMSCVSNSEFIKSMTQGH